MEKYKDVKINERTFRINKFPARTGAFVIVKVTGMLAPIFKSINAESLKDIKSLSGSLDVAGMIEKICAISESDFNYLQDKCLGVCSEVLPGGLAPVMNENGTFGVIDFDDDTMSVLALISHTLIFNLSPLFQGAGLGSILQTISTSSPRD
ncbi:hypothetical protein SAMN04487969_102498 [Paenibacillus algorifonticola]|uniref:Uncharacterized protein n=1 Tax=Paenibacillus algorifonticola TaxID=684063 RepID=A0A1I2AIA5_9BACL|nr:hypothetical protein [Paenibacillus algorifonticola]SFE43447.1 hypothetical protein SAMN04487969_102498 [Paenibacillus algorifonticola]